MVVNMKATGTMVSSTVTAFTDNQMVKNAVENGKKVNVLRGWTRSDQHQ